MTERPSFLSSRRQRKGSTVFSSGWSAGERRVVVHSPRSCPSLCWRLPSGNGVISAPCRRWSARMRSFTKLRATATRPAHYRHDQELCGGARAGRGCICRRIEPTVPAPVQRARREARAG